MLTSNSGRRNSSYNWSGPCRACRDNKQTTLQLYVSLHELWCSVRYPDYTDKIKLLNAAIAYLQ